MDGTGYMVSPNRQEPWVYGNGASCTSRLIPTCSGYKASDMAKDRLPAETRRSMQAAGFLFSPSPRVHFEDRMNPLK
jgi:hypothetical protein